MASRTRSDVGRIAAPFGDRIVLPPRSPAITRISARYRRARYYGARVDVPEHIVCVDCGGRCHRLSYPPDEGFIPGDVIAYRCEDCLDRWDVVMDDIDDGPEGAWS